MEIGCFETIQDALDAAVDLLLDDDRKLERLRSMVRDAEQDGGAYTLEEIQEDVDSWFGIERQRRA